MTFVLKGKAKPLSTMVNTRHDVRSNPLSYWDEELKRNRTLRYSRNQESIFVDEQEGEVAIEPILIEDGALFVPRTNPMLQQFMQLHPDFNNKWEILDKSVDAQVELDREDLIDKATDMYKELTYDQIELIARVDLKKKVMRMESSEVRRDVRRFLRENPEGFMACVDNTDTELKGVAGRAFDEKFLTLRSNGTQVWINVPDHSRTKVMDIPKGEDAVAVVSAHLLLPRGSELLEKLEIALKAL